MANKNASDLHARKLVRVLRHTANELQRLSSRARRLDVWPNTSEKAYVESLKILHNAEIRIAAKDANAV